MKFGRRELIRSAGASLLFSPFYSVLEGRPARAAGKRAKRLFIFFSMGTSPSIWTPTSVTSETSFTFSPSTLPLADIKQHVVLIEGLASANPGNNHGAPDSLTGVGFGGKPMISVDQYIAENLKLAGVNSAIPSLLLSADGTAGGGRSAFHRDKMLPTIASPVSAFNTVFGATAPVGAAPDKLLKRRKSILDLVKGEITTLQKTLGVEERQKLEFHLQSLKQMENRLGMADKPAAVACQKPATAPTEVANPQKANLAHLDIAVSALACDITRVAAVEWGSDQTMQVNLPEIGLQGDQHGGFIHSGGPAFKSLTQIEVWLAQRFVEVVNKLKAIPEADGSGTLLDNSLVVWARDMGDAPGHNQRSMRFVLASGAGGALKTSPTGRYLKNAGGGADRHERVLLYLCDAMGVSDFSGFGDKNLADKTPISALAG